MEQERLNQKRCSQGSIRSMSSDRLSLQRIMEDFNNRVPRYNDTIFVMSIESENENKRRREWDSIENKHNYSITYSNDQKSMEIETQNLSRGSHGIFGKYEQKAQIHIVYEQGITHQCDCYRVCKGQECACSKTLFIQPCKQGKCCVECIENKNKKIFLQMQQQPKISILSQTSSKLYQTPHVEIKNTTIQQSKNLYVCQKSKCLKQKCSCFDSKISYNKQYKSVKHNRIHNQTKKSQLIFQHSSEIFSNQVPKQLPISIEFTNFELPNFYYNR